MDIIIGDDNKRIDKSLQLVIHTEAIPHTQSELKKSREEKIEILTYPQALWKIANQHKLIAISGTHWKSTTTSLTSLVLKNSQEQFATIVGTLLKEFSGKNFYSTKNPEWFTIEACEYKRHFLEYKPFVAAITNIELDHLDYYKDEDDYISAFEKFIQNILPWGFCILNGQDKNCKKLLGLRDDISYVEIFDDYYIFQWNEIPLPKINMQVPGKHVLFDAHISYIIGHMMGVFDENIIEALENYSGVWRRMEIIGKTSYENTLMSDYGHHPTEIRVTLEALKDKSVRFPWSKGSCPEDWGDKILTIFQPHQYSRTLELLEDFKTCFEDTDFLVIPNIYESRDSEEDMKKINSEKLVELIQHPEKTDGKNFKNTLKIIEKYEKKYAWELIILLLWAGDIDNLRYEIKTI